MKRFSNFVGKNGWKIIACLVFLFPGVAYSQQVVSVAAAANTRPLVEEIKIEMSKRGIDIQPSYGSSGKLSSQIMEGAPFDIFISADTKYPMELQNKGLAEKTRIYGSGTLVVWTARKDLNLDPALSVLKAPAVRKIAVANPRVAPYGVAAENALHSLKLYKDIQEKLVYGESIGQVNQFILSGAADVGFTAKSTVLSPEGAGKGNWVEVQPGTYQTIDQAAAVLDHGAKTNSAAALAVYDFLFSSEGRSMLKKFGYLLP